LKKIILETSHGTFAGYALSDRTIAIFEGCDDSSATVVQSKSLSDPRSVSPDGTLVEAMKEWLEKEYNSKAQIKRITSIYVDGPVGLDERHLGEDFPFLAIPEFSSWEDPSKTGHIGRDESPETSTSDPRITETKENHPEQPGEGTSQKVSRKWWHWL
jgi:hypothetical protein